MFLHDFSDENLVQENGFLILFPSMEIIWVLLFALVSKMMTIWIYEAIYSYELLKIVLNLNVCWG